MTDVLYIYIEIAHVLLVYVGLAQARPNYCYLSYMYALGQVSLSDRAPPECQSCM